MEFNAVWKRAFDRTRAAYFFAVIMPAALKLTHSHTQAINSLVKLAEINSAHSRALRCHRIPFLRRLATFYSAISWLIKASPTITCRRLSAVNILEGYLNGWDGIHNYGQQLFSATWHRAPSPLSVSLFQLAPLLFSRSVCSRRKYDADGVEKEVIADMIHVQHRCVSAHGRI